MKTLTQKFRLLICFTTCAVATIFLMTPLDLSAQHPNNKTMQHALNDSMQQRLQKRMAEVGLRIDSLTDYLVNLHPGDEAFSFIAPDFSMIADEAFFDDLRENLTDIEGMSEQLADKHEFDFSGNFFKGKKGAPGRMHFFRGTPDDKGVWVYIDKQDSLADKPSRRVRKVMVFHKGKDTVIYEGNGKMVYTMFDDNGQITVKSNGVDCDTIYADSISQYHVYGITSENENEPFRYNIRRRAGTRGEERPFDRDHFAFNPGNSGAARLSDLTADEINRLRQTDLKPGKKVVPLGIDNLEANLLRRKQQLTLRFNAPGEGELQIQLFDDQGALMHDESLRKFNGRYDNRIALPESHNDILFLRISRGSQSLVKKLEL